MTYVKLNGHFFFFFFTGEKAYYDRMADLATACCETSGKLPGTGVRFHEVATLLEKEKSENKVSSHKDKVSALLTA